jgi:transcriptional regulator with XRE-family HTH domain
MTTGPTVRRRRLGTELRKLRESNGYKLEEVAAQLGVAPSTLSRIETGKAPTKSAYLSQMLESYGVDDPAQRQVLIDMAREGHRKGWWAAYDDVLPSGFDIYVGLEAEATAIRGYETSVVPGLLQTPDYARALLHAERPELLPHEIDRLVELRIRRQEILTRTDPPPPTLWAVMDEAALRRHIGGRETMHAQLQQLIERSKLPNVTLLVMPDDLGAHAGLDGPFAIFQFEASARPVVYVEGQAGNLYLEKDDDLRRCQQTMNHILAAAPGPERSLALIRQVAKEMKP